MSASRHVMRWTLIGAGVTGAVLATLPSLSAARAVQDQEIAQVRAEASGTLLFVVGEGVHVDAGDVLAKIGSDRDDESKSAQLLLTLAESELRTTEAQVEATLHGLERSLQRAEREMDLAKLEYEAALGDGGKLHMELARAQDALGLAKMRTAVLQSVCGEVEAEVSAGRASDSDLELALLELEEARMELRGTERELDHLRRHALPMEELRQKMRLEEAEGRIEEAQARWRAEREQAEAAREAAQAGVQLAMERLQFLEKKSAARTVTAPVAGIVVHGRAVVEGARVREGQPLFTIRIGN